MRLKPFIPLIIAASFIILAAGPVTLAADPEIVPLDPTQGDRRAAYQALFEHLGRGGRAHWAQQPVNSDGATYPAGTIFAPEGIAGDGYDSLVVSATVTTRPALALNAEGTPVAVFRSGVSDPAYGSAAWEAADVRETLETYLWGRLRYDTLDEQDLETADLSRYALLILPAVRWESEQDVLAALDQTALDNLQAFVRAGGFLYAQANGAIIAEAAGVIKTGTVDLDNSLVLEAGTQANAGRLNRLQPDRPLAFSWLTDTLYLLTDPVYEPGPDLEVVAELTNLDGPDRPAVLTGAVGQGRVILVNGHPTAPTRREQLPLFLNAVLWALGQPAELFGQVRQTYNPGLEPDLIPAAEPGAPLSVTLTLANVGGAPLTDVVITHTVAEGFTVDPASVKPAGTVTVGSNPTTTQIVWRVSQAPPGETPLRFTAQTNNQLLNRGELTFAVGEATFTQQGRSHIINHRPFELTARMAARLQGDRDIELDRQFYIPSRGLYLDVALPLENKEETMASQIVVTDVVLLAAPIVDLDDQETILGLNNGETIWVRHEPFFYDEPGRPYLAAEGYAPGDTITLADWEGDYAVFDVPFGTHLCGLSAQSAGNCITIPLSYSQYITVTADNKLLLPAKTLTWRPGDWPGFHYEEPALRYGLHTRELFSRTVTFAGDPGLAPDQLVIQGTGGSIYTHLGDHPIFYRDHLAQGQVYPPEAPAAPRLTYRDIWSRPHTVTLRSAFYDVYSWASCGCDGPLKDRHAALNVTFGLKADTDGDGRRDEEVLVYSGGSEGVDLDIVIKDKALLSAIPTDQMVVDLGVFKGIGLEIGPRFGTWADSWQASSPGVQLIDVEPASTYDHLLFQHDIPAGEATAITLQAVINSDDGPAGEGPLKLHDGARFTYRQQAAGPSRYEVADTHVQGVLGETPDLTITKQAAPLVVSTYGDTLYYVFTVDDKHDPRLLTRNQAGDPFLQTYGFTDLAATTFVGGRDEKQILHSIVRPGEKTRLRIEINNNRQTALTGVAVTPQPPPGLTATPIYTDPANIPPPIWPDLPFLHVQTIPEAGRGVYYFDLFVDPAYSGPRGQVIDIPVAFSGGGGPARFKIPPARLGIEDSDGRVYHSYGSAQTLVLTDSLPASVTLTGAAMVTAGDVSALTKAANGADREAIFNGFEETISYNLDAANQAAFTLPGEALNRLYDSGGDHRLFVVAQAVISPAGPGPTLVNEGAGLRYRDQTGITRRAASDPVEVEAHGSVIRVDYACTGVVNLRPMAGAEAEPATCLVDAGQNEQATLQATIYNDGDYPAQAVEISLNLPPGVTVVETTPAATTAATQTVTWQLGDLAPGDARVVEIKALVSAAQVNSSQNVLEVIRLARGRFIDAFSNRLIKARVGDRYDIPLRYQVRPRAVYLPAVIKQATRRPDLVATDLTVTPPNPATGQPAEVRVVVENRGDAPAAPFWVDFYISPEPVPDGPNLVWHEACGVSPCDGLVWEVNGLAAGESIVLSSAPGRYAQVYSRWTGGFRVAGRQDLYVFVDSWNGGAPAGAVSETDERNNRAEILGIDIEGAPLIGESQASPSLPPRPLP